MCLYLQKYPIMIEKSVVQTALPEHTVLLGSLQLEAACMPLYFDYPIHYGTVVQEDWRPTVWDAHKNLVLKQRKNKVLRHFHMYFINNQNSSWKKLKCFDF